MTTTTPHRQPSPELVLASGSPYRRELLGRLQIEFSAQSPDVPETRLEGEEPAAMATRLAQDKTAAIVARVPRAVVIGSDQIAVRGDTILGKPGTETAAIEQLAACAGTAVEFLTAVCIVDGRQPEAEPFLHVDVTRVQFRRLTHEEIEGYVQRDQPLDCAGGFRCEGLGISLFERIDSQDPTALIGLPLIWVSTVLRQIGFELLQPTR